MLTKKRFTQGLLRVLSFSLRHFIHLLAKVEVEHAEYLKQDRAFILACNHISYWDPPTLIAFTFPHLKEPLLPAATKGLFVFPLSLILKMIKAVPINREAKHLNLNSFKAMINALTQQNRSILFFPQGGIDRVAQSDLAYRGIGLIVLKSLAPVIPCNISGTNHIFSRERFFSRRPKIKISIGKPLLFADVKKHSGPNKIHYQNIAEKIMEEIFNL